MKYDPFANRILPYPATDIYQVRTMLRIITHIEKNYESREK